MQKVKVQIHAALEIESGGACWDVFEVRTKQTLFS